MAAQDHGLPPSSSALIALSSLTPPSPILSPTQLPTTLTSGDIPILLDLVDQAASSSLYEHDHRESRINFEAVVRPSNSNCTVGTFGPTQMCRDSSSWIPEPCQWSSTPGNRDTFGPALNFHSSAWALEAGRSITEDHSQFTISAYLSSSSAIHTLGMAEDVPAPTPGDNLTGGHAACLEDEGLPLEHPVLVHKPDIAQTLPPPSHSDLRYLLSNPLPHRSRQVANSSSSCPSSPRSSRNQSKVVDCDAFGISHTRSGTVGSLPEVFRSPKCSRASNDSRKPTPSHRLQCSQPSLPISLAWLDRSSIELSIDQEGFRAVQARFRFTGYSSRHSWDQYGNSPDNVAQFRPISRQIFSFHYAALEALPVLRRITANGDEARDYITRQASLGLKVNGVYTVRGNEAPSLPATFDTGGTPVKLRWKFEYFVDDRKVDATGKKTVDGEKTLTPLTFSCSPLLLHPFQGKRITMIHMVKKRVATKLVAEKMEPPSTLSPQTPSSTPKPHSQRIPAHVLVRSSVWNMHRRAKSHVPPQTKEHDCQLIPGISYCESPPVSVLQDVDVQRVRDPYARSIRRRRASSAGEMDRPCIAVGSPNANDILCRRSSPAHHPARHIIPRSRLAELLDQETENIPLTTASLPAPMDGSGFQPLKPSPRHHHARILKP